MLLALTAATLVCFSANSLLTRAALGAGLLDPASFTLVRLVSGALTLALLVRLRGGRSAGFTPASEPDGGLGAEELRLRRSPHGTGAGFTPASEPVDSWWSAVWLAGYAIGFTFAYVRIGAAVGALLLFGAVQVTMIGTGLCRGERPARVDWLGVALAGIGILVLTRPGLRAPDPLGAALMIAAGCCWGAYSLAGQRGADPLGRTALNFARASVLALPFSVAGLESAAITASGLAMAVTSGAVASGIGYTLWYTAIPGLAAWRAAVVQLIVPVLTALAAAGLLGEVLTLRLAVATALVAAGVWLTVWPSRHRAPSQART